MAEQPRQLWAWIAKLLPKQKNEGAGAVQVGTVGGNVTSNVTIVNVHAQAEPAGLTTPEQREVLGMIRRLRNAEQVFAFIEREFGTRMVMDLTPSQVLRVRRYVESINKRRSQSHQRRDQ